MLFSKRGVFLLIKIFVAAILSMISLPCHSQTKVQIMDGEINYLFNDLLSEREVLSLKNGEVICSSIGKLKYARINNILEARQLIKAVQEVNPNHLAEIIKILPYKNYENLTEIVSAMLKDEESYTKVPLYTDDSETIYLYSDAKIQKIENQNGREVIIEKFLMHPLDYFTGRIETAQFDSYYFYKMKNMGKIRYKTFFSAIGKEKMIAAISIFRYGDNWIIYALGGVDIIKLPFLDKRIDRAFYNRIKTFCLFTFERLEAHVSKDGES